MVQSSKRLKTGPMSYEPRSLRSENSNSMSLIRGTGASIAMGTSIGNPQVSSSNTGSLSPSYATGRNNDRSVNPSPEVIQDRDIHRNANSSISAQENQGQAGANGTYSTTEAQSMPTTRISQSGNCPLLAAPQPLSSSLKRDDHDRLLPNLSFLVSTGSCHPGDSNAPLHPAISPQLSPPRRAVIRDRSQPSEVTYSSESLGSAAYRAYNIQPRSSAGRPNRGDYEELPAEPSSQAGRRGRLQALAETVMGLTSSTSHRGTRRNLDEDGFVEQHRLSKETQPRRLSLGFNFDPESERQRELEERAAAEGAGHVVPLDPQAHILRTDSQPLTRAILEGQIPPRQPQASHRSQYYMNSANYVDYPDVLESSNPQSQNSREELSVSTSESPAIERERKGVVSKIIESRNNESSKKEMQNDDGGEKECGMEQDSDRDQEKQTSNVEGYGDDEDAKDTQNEGQQRRYTEREGWPRSYSNMKVGKHSLRRHFPHRPLFRRMKTWAGRNLEYEAISQDEMRLLKQRPSCSRPMRRNTTKGSLLLITTQDPITTDKSSNQKGREKETAPRRSARLAARRYKKKSNKKTQR